MYYRIIRTGCTKNVKPFQASLETVDGVVTVTSPAATFFNGMDITSVMLWASRNQCRVNVRHSKDADWTRLQSYEY
ncbi:hypothetical protein XccvBFoX7_gp74c [Xanthomonas phage FoX7]|uniref:Uncharacterized protein n=2 Tax=Carpasinavirus XcP1 TaxID=2182344 RepID=A0A858NQC7_9CAUD|nr:hypothetical protein XccvBFoX6_gp74c [Xanthomonas phage FoX6]QJB22231.1 hypothetical protein XccvBFoX7_gp74c [Xanthomonas phage FoX7]